MVCMNGSCYGNILVSQNDTGKDRKSEPTAMTVDVDWQSCKKMKYAADLCFLS